MPDTDMPASPVAVEHGAASGPRCPHSLRLVATRQGSLACLCGLGHGYLKESRMAMVLGSLQLQGEHNEKSAAVDNPDWDCSVVCGV